MHTYINCMNTSIFLVRWCCILEQNFIVGTSFIEWHSAVAISFEYTQHQMLAFNSHRNHTWMERKILKLVHNTFLLMESMKWPVSTWAFHCLQKVLWSSRRGFYYHYIHIFVFRWFYIRPTVDLYQIKRKWHLNRCRTALDEQCDFHYNALCVRALFISYGKHQL